MNHQKTGRFKPYPAYKDSGVHWLEEVPEHWDVKRVKRVFRVVNGSTPASGEPALWDGHIPWATPEDLGDLSGKTIETTRRNITHAGYSSCGTTIVPAGSLVLSTRAPIGHLALAGIDLCTNQGCRSLVFRNAASSDFFFYQLLAARSELESLGQGSTFRELAKGMLEYVELTDPPASEQRAIAAFLDRESARIDALVAKKERLIELLQEKRTALITSAVTKGLDPTVPMKDSGIKWLREIPAHWEVLSIGRVISGIEQGWSPVAEDRQAEPGEWGVIKLSAVERGAFVPVEHKALPIGLAPDVRYEIRDGDFLLTRSNTPELVGDVCVVRRPPPRLMLCDLVYRLDLRRNAVVPGYLSYWLLSPAGRYQIEVEARGASQSMVKVSQGLIRSWSVLLPPTTEQHAIVAFLDQESARIDSLISKVRDAIDRLKELRTALISAAVTGKIDVREGAA